MQKYSKENRRNLLHQWRESGKSGSAFCEENGISRTTFQNWKKWEREERPSGELVEITRPATAALCENGRICIEFRAFRITVPVTTGQAEINTILKALRDIAC
jgi:transposase-like protein